MSANEPPNLTAEKVLEIGSRLKSGPSEILIDSAFAWELKHQEHLFESIGLCDIAQTLVALELGAVPETEGRELLGRLLELQNKPQSFIASADKGDIYTNREAWLADRSDATNWLGAGRARREATTAAFVLTQRTALLRLNDALTALGQAMVDTAEQHCLSIMPDYTYLQAAQPTTFGHYLLGFAYPLLRDLQRLELLLNQLNKSPLGCGSTNGSRILQGRRQLAELLGFDGIISHARDAMWQADLCIECAALLSACSVNLSRLAEDLQIFSTQEFALIELDDRHARASKIMPQKKNPFALTHVRAVANKMTGLAATVSATSRTPSGQPDNRLFIYGELPEGLQLVAQAAALMTEVITHLSFDSGRGRQLVKSGWALSTDLAETLVTECGLDFRSAHRLVGFLAGKYPNRSIFEIDCSVLIETAENLFGQTIAISEDKLRSALDPAVCIQSRTERGGTAIHCMAEMIEECRTLLGYYRETGMTRLLFIENKRDSLLQLASALVSL